MQFTLGSRIVAKFPSHYEVYEITEITFTQATATKKVKCPGPQKIIFPLRPKDNDEIINRAFRGCLSLYTEGMVLEEQFTMDERFQAYNIEQLLPIVEEWVTSALRANPEKYVKDTPEARNDLLAKDFLYAHQLYPTEYDEVRSYVDFSLT